MALLPLFQVKVTEEEPKVEPLAGLCIVALFQYSQLQRGSYTDWIAKPRR